MAALCFGVGLWFLLFSPIRRFRFRFKGLPSFGPEMAIAKREMLKEHHMKPFIGLLLLMGMCSNTFLAQVKIGENPGTIDSASALEIESTSLGFLPPRMTTVQRDTQVGWDAGHVIYNTDENCLQVFDGTAWNCLEKTAPGGGGGPFDPLEDCGCLDLSAEISGGTLLLPTELDVSLNAFCGLLFRIGNLGLNHFFRLPDPLLHDGEYFCLILEYPASVLPLNLIVFLSHDGSNVIQNVEFSSNILNLVADASFTVTPGTLLNPNPFRIAIRIVSSGGIWWFNWSN